jgi:hypothetical protein
VQGSLDLYVEAPSVTFVALEWHVSDGYRPESHMNTEADDGIRTRDTWLGKQN